MEPETRILIARLAKDLDKIYRCDNAITSIKRCLGDRLKFCDFAVNNNEYSPPLSLFVKPVHSSLVCCEETDSNYEESCTTNELRATENIERIMDILGIIHRTLCVSWKLTHNVPYISMFVGNIFDDLPIQVSIHGPISPAYKEVKDKDTEQISTTTVGVCEIGWQNPEGFD